MYACVGVSRSCSSSWSHVYALYYYLHAGLCGCPYFNCCQTEAIDLHSNHLSVVGETIAEIIIVKGE